MLARVGTSAQKARKVRAAPQPAASAMVVRKRPKYGRSVTFIKIVTRSGVSHGSLTRGCVIGLRTRYLSSHAYGCCPIATDMDPSNGHVHNGTRRPPLAIIG